MSECNHDCSSCSKSCSEKKSLIEQQNDKSNIKRVIGVISGKGGVGKSLISSTLAVLMNKIGYKTAILDADITGPSIPKMFGIKDKATSPDGKYLLPIETKSGIKIMSINLLLENDTDPVVWRGPVIAGAVKQFWTDVAWGDVDYMFVDMPPGTGDVALTVFQSLPIEGIVVITSPQDLVSMIVGKAVKMANMMNIPVLGLVENMSYLECPDCKKKIEVFGKSKIDSVAKEYEIDTVAKLPINPAFASLADSGEIEEFDDKSLKLLIEKIIKIK